MPDEDKKRAFFRELIDRVVNGDGHASTEDRGRAFRNRGLPPPVNALIDKVARRPSLVTDADITAAQRTGWTEDQLFELITCAAVGESARQYQSGLAALGAATGARAIGSGTSASDASPARPAQGGSAPDQTVPGRPPRQRSAPDRTARGGRPGHAA